MLGASVANRLKALDVYKKMPRELTEATVSGAMVSLVSMAIMIILFCSEFFSYMSTYETTEMYIDVDKDAVRLVVNMDIIMHKMPCDIVSLDYQDAMGSHTVNVEGNLDKIRVKPNGEVVEVIPHDKNKGEGGSELNFERAKKAFHDKEGCQLKGFIYVHKVPGNFHISSHAYGNQIFTVFQQNGIQTLDLSHTVNHLSFGEEDDFKAIRKKFGGGVLTPLDGTVKTTPDHRGFGFIYQYYLNVVPTTYEDLSHNKYYVHQFTALFSEFGTNSMPVLFFRYDLSPVTVKFILNSETFPEFLVQICAIVGGVFTVSGIIDAMIHKSVMTLIKKAQQGKLS